MRWSRSRFGKKKKKNETQRKISISLHSLKFLRKAVLRQAITGSSPPNAFFPFHSLHKELIMPSTSKLSSKEQVGCEIITSAFLRLFFQSTAPLPTLFLLGCSRFTSSIAANRAPEGRKRPLSGHFAGIASSARPRTKPESTRTTSTKAAGLGGSGGCFRSVPLNSPPLSLHLLLQKTLQQYDVKLCKLLDTYDKAFLVHADNVGSRQFMDIRRVSFLNSQCFAVRSPSIDAVFSFSLSPPFSLFLRIERLRF